MSIIRAVFLMVGIGLSPVSQSLAYDNCTEDSKKCSVAIFPHSNFKQLLITYKSLLEDLSLILDSRVKLVSTRTMSDFAYKLDKKVVDVALVGSGQYISHAHPAGYIPLASRDEVLVMRLFVKPGSNILSYQDLVGRKMGFMALNTTTWYSASILLKNNGIDKADLELVKLGSQQACAHAMAINKVDACIFAVSNLEIIKQQNVNVEFKPIGDALNIHNPVYAAHPDMPKEIIEEIKSYLLSRDGYIEVKDSDFDEFRHYISLL